jgi:hypothetical protein
VKSEKGKRKEQTNHLLSHPERSEGSYQPRQQPALIQSLVHFLYLDANGSGEKREKIKPYSF